MADLPPTGSALSPPRKSISMSPPRAWTVFDLKAKRDRNLALALVREYLEPEEVYEKRPPRGRRSGPGRERTLESVRIGPSTQCSGASARAAEYSCPDGETEERNLQLMCGYCNWVKGTEGEGRVPAEDGGTAGRQRGHGGDAGREASGPDGEAAGPISP